MTCAVCQRDEKAVNSTHRECAHVDCPHRRRLTAQAPTRHTDDGLAPGCVRISMPPKDPHDHD